MAMQTEPKQQNEIEKAKALVEAEKQERAKKVGDLLDAMLKENKCGIDFSIRIGEQAVPASMILKERIILHIVPQ